MEEASKMLSRKPEKNTRNVRVNTPFLYLNLNINQMIYWSGGQRSWLQI
jgi:hypothetical protein